MAITKEQWDAAVAEFGPRVRVVSFQDPESDETIFEGIVRAPRLPEFATFTAGMANADGDAKKILDIQRWYCTSCCTDPHALETAVEAYPFLLSGISLTISKLGGAGAKLISKKFEGPSAT
jgi:hypothetical protein